jgi:hypothetical protein
MFSGEPADSHNIHRTSSSGTFMSPRSDCTCSRTSGSVSVSTCTIGKFPSRARCSQNERFGADDSMAASPSASSVSVPMTSSRFCCASPTRKEKSSAVDGSAHCRSSMTRMSGEPPASPPTLRNP